jgi:hypothetical protein
MRKTSVRFAAVVLAGLVGIGGAAVAETRTVVDESGPAPQGPANSLIRGTFTYTDAKSSFKAKIVEVKKKRTWVGAHIYYPDDSNLWLRTFYRDGGTEKVTKATYYANDGTVLARPSVRSRWNLDRDTVTIILNNLTDDPKPKNVVADLDLYTVAKGADHGPLCEIDPETGEVVPCNDDYVFARRMRR